jgi:hypothetical protein
MVPAISPSTMTRWLREEHIKPWQYHAWQQPTDPRFLEKATVVWQLDEQAQALARRGEIIVCTDEKTSIQARQLTGGVAAACPGHALRTGDRYQRQGALQLFAGLRVHTGETIARCLPRKRFVEFQLFLRMVFTSLWCQGITVLHLILDNGTTHAPKQLDPWIGTLQLPFEVRVHWLPIHASWLDQVELVFSPLQRKVLTPNHCAHLDDLETAVMAYFAERNRHPTPIQWSYTVAQLQEHLAHRSVAASALCT